MLTITNLVKSFQQNATPVLNQLNLSLEAQDFCVIIGSNGCGKSTLMKTLSGDYLPDGGQIILQKSDVTFQDRSHLIASVTQDIRLGSIPEMTLLENMVLTALRGKSAKLAFYRQYAALATSQLQELGMGLEKALHAPLGNLSGGQRQLIATLMAIQSKPSLLLLDEHTSALDPAMQVKLMAYTASRVHAENLTCLMVTHNLNDAIQYGNRLIQLDQGRVVFDIRGDAKKRLTRECLLRLFSQSTARRVEHVL